MNLLFACNESVVCKYVLVICCELMRATGEFYFVVHGCLYVFSHYNYVVTNACFVHVGRSLYYSCSARTHLYCAEKLFGDRLVFVLLHAGDFAFA